MMEHTWDRIWEAAKMDPRSGEHRDGVFTAAKVWKLFELLEDFQSAIPHPSNDHNIQENYDTIRAKSILCSVILKGLELMQDFGLPGARTSTAVRFYHYSNSDELVRPLRSTLALAHRARDNGNTKDLGVRFELFVVIAMTLLEHLCDHNESPVDTVLPNLKLVSGSAGV
jgi:hypothetical protein